MTSMPPGTTRDSAPRLREGSRRTERMMLAGSAVVALLLAGLAVAIHAALERSRSGAWWVAHTHEVVARIRRTSSLLKDAGPPRPSRLVGSPARAIELELAYLGRLTGDNPTQVANVASLLAVARRRRAVDADGVDDGLGLCESMEREERRLLGLRMASLVASDRETLLVACAGVGLGLAILVAAVAIVRRELRRRLASEARFEAFMDHGPMVAFIKDVDSRFLFLNHPAEHLLGVRAAELVGRAGPPGMPSEVLEALRMNDRVVLESGEPAEFLEDVPGIDGRPRTWRATKFPFRDEAGRIMLGGVAFDLTDQKLLEAELAEKLRLVGELNARLEHLAGHDSLTGLRNVRSFREALDLYSARLARSGEPLSVAMIDVDLFKSYNDEFGHPAGDEVLRRVGTILAAWTRGEDVAARYGGEEFALLLPGADSEAARAAAERLRSAVDSHPWPDRPVTVSVGVATSRAGSADAESLLGRADRALYAAKRDGRNRVSSGDCAETVSEAR